MKILCEFLRISGKERRLLIWAVFLVAGIRIGLWSISFHNLRRLLAKIAQRTTCPYTSPDCIVSAVVIASKRIPKATCLTQALALQALRQRQGYAPGVLRIGVVRNAGDPLRAHAWVESGREILIGKVGNLSCFTPLRSLANEVDTFKWII